MKTLFVDTAGWMCMADRKDPKHKAFSQTRDNWLRDSGVLVTTDYVLDETLTLISMRLGIEAAEKWWGQVSKSPRLKSEVIDYERAERARIWFFNWKDKSFSFTDCTSFIVMKELEIEKSLTSDKHFVEAGFEILP